MPTYKTQDGATHDSRELAIEYCLKKIEDILSQLLNSNSPRHQYLHDNRVCGHGSVRTKIETSNAEKLLTSLEAWKAQIFVLERMK